MSKLKLDHDVCGLEVLQFRGGNRTFLHDLLEEERVLSHALHWLQQVTCQIHLIVELQLFLAEEVTDVWIGEQLVRPWFVLVVEGVEVEVFFMIEEAVAEAERVVTTSLHLLQEVLTVKGVDVFNVSKHGTALSA